MTSYYDDKYFEWQKQCGKIGGILNKFKFEKHVKESDILLDFGCGGGYLLSNFNNKNKVGIEINKSAWVECNNNNISVTNNFDSIVDNSIDTIISNHAMEHVPLPLDTLKELFKKLKPSGTMIIVIPCEQPSEPGFYYKPNDINQHLHTWCPMTFGNLANVAGFTVQECNPFYHQWTPDFKETYQNINFHKKCIEYAKKNGNIQIKLIATKI
jgi:SAM-dependent methyltransferase